MSLEKKVKSEFVFGLKGFLSFAIGLETANKFYGWFTGLMPPYNMNGLQTGIFNLDISCIERGLTNSGQLKGAQLSLINGINYLHGIQIGLINYARFGKGLQIGLINVSDRMQDNGYTKSIATPLIGIIDLKNEFKY
jgi:hypothetical protein